MTLQYRSIKNFCPDINEKIKGWNKAQEEAMEEQSYNPFSAHYKYKRQLSKDDPEYGFPMKHTLSYRRGQKAFKRVKKEIAELCAIIHNTGVKLRDGSVGVKFGRLFATYVGISDKVVGMLIRARRHGYVEFPGEVLYQRQDEDVTIRLVRLPDSLLDDYEQLVVEDFYGERQLRPPVDSDTEESDVSAMENGTGESQPEDDSS